MLPDPTVDLLRGTDRTRYEVPGADIWCSDMTTQEARALAETLDGAVIGSDDRSIDYRLGYLLEAPDLLHAEISIFLEPYLPHDEFQLCSPYG